MKSSSVLLITAVLASFVAVGGATAAAKHFHLVCNVRLDVGCYSCYRF